ncbi:programmed cell death protein 2 [Polychytrium aggregatum]|uniref:programmed cell death protein 2 n=1 Tax=Polychytrium aggregatum TaxID=110093 RepID=UPI0022FE735D|nr:programmed cell death protein 2 [Polychytrium aggregatum]KAI9207245.1 programmed cell death protein 2 [Polychytrium aggregatum]
MSISLGFVEPVDPTDPLIPDLHSFPDKVGGLPLWLAPIPMKSDSAKCGVCEKIMPLLLQMYTPEDNSVDAFHRVVYVFCCKNGSCHKTSWKKAIKVFRSQLPEDNPYYDLEARNVPMCFVCGMDGTKRCAKCQVARYCSREHQLVHWNQGGHKQQCPRIAKGESIDNDQISADWLAKVVFPEYELVSEAEPDPKTHRYEDDDKVKQLMDGAAIEEADPDEVDEDSKVDVDKAFLKFQKRLMIEPEQVVRYNRNAEGEVPPPLWGSDMGKPTDAEVGLCLHCGGKREFEFQVMPQLLNYIENDHSATDSLDWGTLLVFSCTQNCQPKDMTYIEEFVWRQDFTENGWGDSLRKGQGEPPKQPSEEN